MLRKVRIGTRLMLIVVVAVIGMIAVGAIGLVNLRDNLIADRQVQTRTLIQSALGTVSHYHAEAVAGRISMPEAQQRAMAALRDVRFGANDYYFIYRHDGTVLMLGPRPDLEGQELSHLRDINGVAIVRDLIAAARSGDNGFLLYHWPRAGQQEHQPKLSYAANFEPWEWVIGTGIYIDDVDAVFWRDVGWIGGITLGLLAVVAGIAAFVAGSITRPLSVVTGIVARLAGGETAIAIPHAEGRDEIGDLARAVQVFKTNAIERARLEAEQAAERAERERRTAHLEQLIAEFRHSISDVVQAVAVSSAELQANSQSMTAIAEQTSSQSVIVAAAAAQSSGSVESVAAATQEIDASIGQIGQQIGVSVDIAAAAVEEARRTNATVEGLSVAAGRIGEILDLISGIAAQTNLLALNASIESARAGQAGKGFAVVASEVKSLASQTARATKDISAQIAAMRSATTEAVGAIKGIGGTIARLNEIANSIAANISEQGTATGQISRNVRQAAAGSLAVSQSIGNVTEASSQATRTAQQVLEASRRLASQGDRLQTEVDGFIAKVKAA